MLRHRLRIPPEHLYPTHEWRIVETGYASDYFARAETALSLSNGYLGIRGTPDEGRPAVSPGTFVNGFHETWPIVHPEEAYGLARTGQTLVDVPDATVIRLYVDDEPLFLPTAHLRDYRRVLDMRDGTLTRELTWSTSSGRHVRVRSCRLVSLEHRHLAAITYEVVVQDHASPVVITSEVLNRQDGRTHATADGSRGLDPRGPRALSKRVLSAEIAEASAAALRLGYRTTGSGMTLGVAVDHLIETRSAYDMAVVVDGDRGELTLTMEAPPGVPIRITKFVAYHSSHAEPASEMVKRCRWTLDHALREGFDAVRTAQRRHLDRFWDRADVRVGVGEGSARTQQAIRWNLFQVAQATWRAEGTGVPAKGLTGPAYDGHFFWDTEVYVLPFLSYTQPRIARNLLRFRHSMLPAARRRAREIGQQGAMFPWRTINGEEASAYYQAGTAQYHINADIAYAIRRYVQVREDPGFLLEVGAEMLVETARLWADLGFYADDGEFHLHGVTGPDEYTTVVNDNAYTNLMARLNLRYAVESLRWMELERPDASAALRLDLALGSEEIDAWERAAAAMHIPYDKRRGMHPQDAQFLEREVWDLEATPPDHFPLLLHYHPLVIYRHQVIKQADIVLATFLLGHEFDGEQKRANFEYYDALTTGDSSLSACVQSIVAAEVGDEDRALEYFRFALLMDLADAAGNSSDGVHIACAAGVWQALVFGFGGVRDSDGALSITPRLPKTWDRLEFSLRHGDRQLRVQLAHDEERYVIENGAPLRLRIRGRWRVLEAGRPLVIAPALT